MKKIKLTESDLYRIVKKVLLEQKEERVWMGDGDAFKRILNVIFNNDSEKLTKIFNKKYDRIIVRGFLDLRGEPIQSLPDNLKVIGSLSLTQTPIKILPNNLTVTVWLDIRKTQIEELPEDLKVTHEIFRSRSPKKNSELKEQEPTGGEKPAYPAVTKWDSGVKRGPANPINPKQKWSETYPIKRGKANTIDQKNKWSTDLTRGKANTLL